MKVLVIDNLAAGYADLPAIKQILDFVGTPYTVMNYTDVTPAMLSDGTCHGYFQGVIMAFGDDIYSGNANLYTTLNSYETDFPRTSGELVLQSDSGLRIQLLREHVPSTATYNANFTAAAASVFPDGQHGYTVELHWRIHITSRHNTLRQVVRLHRCWRCIG